MSDQAISMWHLDEMLDDMAEECVSTHSGVPKAVARAEMTQEAPHGTVHTISELLVRFLYDPEMRLVFSGPGGLPYLVRKFARYGFILLERTRMAAAG